ncbi:hypothetical protein BRD20_08420 [Halobacteriales archaeon SW_8_65_20]|nr:MAG: hypothetical protein BRC71_08135 [Halobacteriales archaeon QH_7_65_31]PSQ52238.1 MAG: hypothetical protein BRD20_08420 [Halobacteriales archaeon SW_8_65_20]
MSQSSFDDDELFGEAATEMRAEVEDALAEARAALPDADSVWAVDADNTLGVLNALKGALDTGDAADSLREAKKQFVIGQRADAFEDGDDLEAEIDELESLLGEIETAHGEAADLASTLPGLRGALQDADGEASAEADDE